MPDRVKRAKLRMGMVLGVMGGVALLFLFVMANVLYPYRSVIVYEYRAMPTEICPGGDVSVEVEQEIRDDLRVLEIVSQWRARGDPATFVGGQARFEDVAATPRKTVISPLVRSAPTTPGLWKLETSYDVFGTRFGLPVRQDLDDITSENFVRVLESNDEKCGGRS